MPFVLKHKQALLAAGLCAAILFAATQQVALGRGLAILYLFWHYAFMLVLVGLAVMAIFARVARPICVVLAITAVLSFGWPAASDYFANTPFSSKGQGPVIKVITFNWLGGDRPRDDIYAWLKAEQPDILAIEEFSASAKGVEQSLFPMFPFRSDQPGDIIILSKYPISHGRHVTMAGHSFLSSLITVNGQDIVVYGLHPSTLRSSSDLALRNAYMALAADEMDAKAQHRLVMGDLNTTRWDPWFGVLIARQELHEEPRLFPRLTRMGVRSGLPWVGSPIDHILVSRGDQLSRCRTGPSLGSDHLPLVCQLTLGTGGRLR